jgi:hypothetical protein
MKRKPDEAWIIFALRLLVFEPICAFGRWIDAAFRKDPPC